MSRPRELRADTIRKACSGAMGHLGLVEANAPLIEHRGNSDCGEALSGRSYDGVNRGGNNDTHPEREAGKFDPVAIAIVEFQTLLVSVARDAARLRKLGESLAVVRKVKSAEVEEGESRSPGAGDCVNCGTFCVGLRDDRLKSGRCEPCYVYRLRHEMERPRELWTTEEHVA